MYIYITTSIEQVYLQQTRYLRSQMYSQSHKNMNMTLGSAVGGSLLFLMPAMMTGVITYLKKLKESSVF